jgi:hypothetical protein
VGLLDPRAEVVTTGDGWVWLRPEPRSLKRRQTLAWALVTLAVGAGAASVAHLPLVPALVVAAAALVTALGLVRAAVRSAHTRAGACAVGVLLQMGVRVVQAGWDAVGEVRALPAAGRRARLVLATDAGPTHATPATFPAEPVATWLARAEAAAREGGRRTALLDGGPDFAVVHRPAR